MKNKFIKVCLILGVSALVLSCGRRDDDDTKPNNNSDNNFSNYELTVSTQQSGDNKEVEENVDQAIQDVTGQLSSYAGGREDALGACGYTVATITGNKKSFKITFTGEDCALVGSREGTITVTLVAGDKYTDKGAKWNMVFDGYGITKKGKKLSLKGTHVVENITGGAPYQILIPNISNVTTVSLLVTSADMNITFDTTKASRQWNVARKIMWSNVNNEVIWTLEGAGSADGYDNLVTWGTNRAGANFYTQISSPITINASKCGLFRPTGGERIHNVVVNGNTKLTSTESFEYNSSGCANKYILVVEKNKKTRTIEVTF